MCIRDSLQGGQQVVKGHVLGLEGLAGVVDVYKRQEQLRPLRLRAVCDFLCLLRGVGAVFDRSITAAALVAHAVIDRLGPCLLYTSRCV